jgi:hypothetical protein
MRDKIGLAVPGDKRGRRSIGFVVALLALTALIMPALASAKTPVTPTKTYLALGDSLAFGFTQQLYNQGIKNGDPASGFETGYANDYLKALKSPTTRLTNDGCPGETTESFIGKNPVLLNKLNTALKAKQEEQKLPEVSGNESEPEAHKLPNCEYQEEWNLLKTDGKGGPLHHPYVLESQLENAIKTIKEDSTSTTPVTTVSVDIGTGDVFHTLAKTEFEVRKEIEVKVLSVVLLKQPEFTEAVANAAKARIEAALLAERPNIGKECETQALKELLELKITEGQVLGAIQKCVESAAEPAKLKDAAEHNYAKEVEELVAAGAAKYAHEHMFELTAEGEKKAEEKIKAELHEFIGQINSNILGILTAIRQAGTLELGGVDYNGQIIFQSSYDPYGKQFQFASEGTAFVAAHGGPEGPYAIDNGRCIEHAATEAEENEHITTGHCVAAALHIGFNAIIALLNNETFETAHKVARACDTDPGFRFNPGNSVKPQIEPERLRKWTNMTNVTECEGRHGGPDVTTTPGGSKELSTEIVKEAKVCHSQEEKEPGAGPLGF